MHAQPGTLTRTQTGLVATNRVLRNTYAARVVNGRQIKGDPSVRAFLFDTSIDRLQRIVLALLTRKGVFHTNIHYSSSQLT